MRPSLKDAQLKITRAMPNGAQTVNSDGLDLGKISDRDDFVAGVELLITAPALAVGVLADAATCKYHLQCDSVSNFATPRTLANDVITQTGAGGAGAAGTTARFRLPTDVEQYVRLVVVKSGAGDASASNATMEVLR